MKYGIIGYGVVGQAIDKGSQFPAAAVIDIVDEKRRDTEALKQCDVVFLCVPTPTVKHNEQDLHAVGDNICRLSNLGFHGVIVIKSTVLPGTTRGLQKEFPDLKLVHSPEFLTARTAMEDFREQHTILMSGQYEHRKIASKMYMQMLQNGFTSCHSDDFEVSEWAKYIHNGALPVMLSFLNEIWAMVDGQDVFDAAVNFAFMQGNLPRAHAVPGPDGELGWGGACFPKDMQALMGLARVRDQRVPTIAGAIHKNRQVRPQEYHEHKDV